MLAMPDNMYHVSDIITSEILLHKKPISQFTLNSLNVLFFQLKTFSIKVGGGYRLLTG